MKRYLYIIHRWLGIVLCLFMAMWFFSGVVMMYVGYPHLTNIERLQTLPKLAGNSCCIDLSAVLAATEQKISPESIRLTSIANTPRFILTYGKNQHFAIDAITGKRITQVTEADVLASAQNFMHAEGRYIGSVDEDPWTHSRALDGFRPLHRVLMQDADNTLLYVSSTTGEVVRDATSTERGWNWLGAWIHWLYPFRGGFFSAETSANIIIYSSLIGCFVVLTGMIVGIMRWRFVGQFKHGGKTPYRTGFMRWHHLFGLVFGIIAFTWIFSGLMSMNPWKIFDSDAPKLNTKAYQVGELNAQSFPLSMQQALVSFQSTGFYPSELELKILDGNGYFIGFDNTGQTSILNAEADPIPFKQFAWQQLEIAAQRLMGGAKVVESSILTDYDFYYYQRAAHTMTGHIDKRLPVLRLKFDDPYATWLHIDPYTASVVKLDSFKRTSRWLFAFLHSWDWLPLLNSRPLWDGMMISLSLGGFVLSASGVVIGWRRLGRNKTAKRKLAQRVLP